VVAALAVVVVVIHDLLVHLDTDPLQRRVGVRDAALESSAARSVIDDE
jgi:hypothetical protein